MKTSHGLLISHGPPSADVLCDWLDRHGVTRCDNLVVQPTSDGSGWAIRSTRVIQVDEILCQVPKTALLSAQTSSLPMTVDTVHTSTPSHSILFLALAVLHELRLGYASAFYGYLQSLPRRTIRLPVFWTVEELAGEDGLLALEWLRGTEAERELLRKHSEGLSLEQMRLFYGANAINLPPTNEHPGPSPFLAFLHAYSLVSTRAFLVDLYHTVALCPFADIFNHSANAHTSLSSDEFVCHHCGSLPACPHDRLTPIGVPQRLAHLPLRIQQRLSTEQDTVEMRAERLVECGEEVFNCYGDAIGDARLLVEWGFIAEEYAGEGLRWSLEDILSRERDRNAYRRIQKHGALRDILFGEASSLPIDDEEALFCPSSSALADVTNLTLIAQVSSNVLIAVAVGSLQELNDHTTSVTSAFDEYQAKIVSIAETLAATAVGGTGSAEQPPQLGHDTFRHSLKVAEAMVTLLQRRIASMYRPELTEAELFDALDRIPVSAELQRMALKVALNERSVIKVAVARWSETLDKLQGQNPL